MAKKELPSPEILRKLLRYEPDTGKLFWRQRQQSMPWTKIDVKIWNARWSGMEAFTNDHNEGYKRGPIFGTNYRAHRVIWAMVHGEWPVDQIDHINGDPSDNRIDNLRVVSASENAKNQKIRSTNRSGVMGVYLDKDRGKWRAQIYINGRKINLGRFENFREAVASRSAAEEKYGYHDNHRR